MNSPAPRRNLVRRLLVAAVVGVVVAVVSYLSAFHFLRFSFVMHSPAWTTWLELKTIAATIERHKEQQEHFPARMTEIEGLKDALKHDDEGRIVDRWGHPYQYSATDDGFTLFSFGRDGQPGGDGDDADVYHDRPLEGPSLHRFTFELTTGPVRWACLLSGIGAAVVVGSVGRGGWGGLLVRAVVTTLGAIFVAVVISAVHVPSGH